MMIRIFNEENHFLQETVDQIMASLPNGRGTLALSGGSTPRKVYEALPPLPNVEFFQVDERYIPRDNQESNYKLIMETAKPKRFHAFDTSLPIEGSLQKYEEELPKDPFDLIILGIGPDGHIASLFPGSKALEEKSRPVAHTTTDAFTVHDRLTITFPVIMKAKRLLVLLQGKEKQNLLNRLMGPAPDGKPLPAQKLLKHSNLEIHLFLPLK